MSAQFMAGSRLLDGGCQAGQKYLAANVTWSYTGVLPVEQLSESRVECIILSASFCLVELLLAHALLTTAAFAMHNGAII
jgi:hypothetical protein